MANLTDELPAEFLNAWGGCNHLDCLPKCWIKREDGHCERMAIALQDYMDGCERMDNGRNTGGKLYR